MKRNGTDSFFAIYYFFVVFRNNPNWTKHYQKLKLTVQRNKKLNEMKLSERIGHLFGTISETVGDSWDAAIGDTVDEFKKGYNKAKD